MKLTEKHIEDLMLFTKKHYVPYYDLQMELVDHLANDIEELINANPRLSYEEAKRIAFKKFGVFGFQETIEAKRKALNKRYFKLFLSTFLNYFTIPKIAVNFSLFIVYYYLINIFSTHLKEFYLLSFLFVFIYNIYKAFNLKLKLKKKKKKWLFETMIDSSFTIIMSFNFIVQTVPLFLIEEFKKTSHNQQTLLFLSLFFMFYVIVMHIITYDMPKKISLIMQKEYPNYRAV